ncbi:MAG TPA: roadblock/LC7 domain-containing protein [Streptosporangiaceae bacterium]|nr:roadblock/LC7 domain-containing protein [Streptosporangiaceae bacterium]
MTSSIDFNWFLDDLVARVPQIEKAVVLSRDGLATGASTVLAQDEAERLAAIAAGFHSLARGASGYLAADQVRQVIVEMAGAYLFVTAAGENGCLAVVTTATADVGLVAYEMAVLVKRMNGDLPAPRRASLGGGTM